MDTDYSLHISAVNYLNARPLIAGIQASALGQQHRLSLDTPAEAARKVLSGEADIGLVPVATAKQLCSQAGGYHIVSQYGIGCHGPVATVCVFSQVPLHRIERLYLDYQSRS
jgi:chorismate dehydratase